MILNLSEMINIPFFPDPTVSHSQQQPRRDIGQYACF